MCCRNNRSNQQARKLPFNRKCSISCWLTSLVLITSLLSPSHLHFTTRALCASRDHRSLIALPRRVCKNKTHSVASKFKWSKTNLEERITAGNIKLIKGIDCHQKGFVKKCFYSLKMNMLKVVFLSRASWPLFYIFKYLFPCSCSALRSDEIFPPALVSLSWTHLFLPGLWKPAPAWVRSALDNPPTFLHDPDEE